MRWQRVCKVVGNELSCRLNGGRSPAAVLLAYYLGRKDTRTRSRWGDLYPVRSALVYISTHFPTMLPRVPLSVSEYMKTMEIRRKNHETRRNDRHGPTMELRRKYHETRRRNKHTTTMEIRRKYQETAAIAFPHPLGCSLDAIPWLALRIFLTLVP